jgi:uncharacterized protein
MKYLLVLAVIFVALWLFRSNRREAERDENASRQAPPPPLQPPQDMVRCPVCSIHLPRADALRGPDGQLYCSPDHRRQADG